MRGSTIRQMGRRAAISCGCVGLLLPLATARARNGFRPFCASLSRGQVSLSDTSNTTGRKDLDDALIFESGRVRTFFSVHPGFRILDDDGAPNAFATPDSLMENTTGTVLLGRTLILSELVTRMGGIAVGGIIAHECAHILQFHTEVGQELTAGQPTARLMELHADYMAGFYFGVRAASKSLDVEPFARSLFNKGDWAFNSPGHHGTPEERTAAMYAGYDFGRRYDATTSQASTKGAAYVRAH